MGRMTITLSGTQPLELFRQSGLSLETKVASAQVLLADRQAAVVSRMARLRSASGSQISAHLSIRGGSDVLASALAPLAGNPASATVDVIGSSLGTWSQVVKLKQGAVDWIRATVGIPMNMLPSTSLVPTRGVSVSSVQAVIEGRHSDMLSGIARLSGDVPVKSVRLRLRGDARDVSSSLQMLSSGARVDGSAVLGLVGHADNIISGFQTVPSAMPISARINLRGRASDVVSSIVALEAVSWRIDLFDASPSESVRGSQMTAGSSDVVQE
jgi:hypothetical protein